MLRALQEILLYAEKLLSLTNTKHVRYEVFTAVSMKNGVFWDVTPCGHCKNRHFGVDPVPDTLLLRKSGSAVNRTRTSGLAARNSDH
jgi:hypothetical protein